MNAAWPATRSAHSFFKLRAYPFDVLLSGLRFLDRDCPANPLVARKRSDVLPFCSCRRIRNKGLSQILGHFVYRTGGYFFFHLLHLFSPLSIKKSPLAVDGPKP